MGGFYERLVGCVKNSLKAAVDRKRLDLIELQTVVLEVATVVNSRPLLYSEEEIGDFPLTPAHLIMRHPSIFTLVPGEDDDEDDESPNSVQRQLIASWKRIQHLLDGFWKVWRRSYLVGLQEHHRTVKQRNVCYGLPNVGAVVQIADDHLPRSQWKIGRIVELIYSADNLCRSVKLLLPGGRFMNRPIKLLYPLELSEPPNSVDNIDNGILAKTGDNNGVQKMGGNDRPPAAHGNTIKNAGPNRVDISAPKNDPSAPKNDPPPRRSRRGAARRARQQIKQLSADVASSDQSE